MSEEHEASGWGALFSAALNFVPILGNAKGLYEAWTGEDAITDAKLGVGERVLGALGVGGALFKTAGSVTDVAELVIRGTDAIDAAEKADKLMDTAKSAKSLGKALEGVNDAADAKQLYDAAGGSGESSDNVKLLPDRILTEWGGGEIPIELGPVPPASDAPPSIARDGTLANDFETRELETWDGPTIGVLDLPGNSDAPAVPATPSNEASDSGSGKWTCEPGDGLDAPATPGPTSEASSQTVIGLDSWIVPQQSDLESGAVSGDVKMDTHEPMTPDADSWAEPAGVPSTVAEPAQESDEPLPEHAVDVNGSGTAVGG